MANISSGTWWWDLELGPKVTTNVQQHSLALDNYGHKMSSQANPSGELKPNPHLSRLRQP